MAYTVEERAEALGQLKRQFPAMSEAELQAAMDGDEISVSVREGGKPGNRVVNRIEGEIGSNGDLDECLTIAKDAFDIAMEAAKAIDSKIGRLVAETVARIAYAVGRAFCRAEYG